MSSQQFFSQFPKTKYDFEANGILTTIVDIFRFVKANDRFLDDVSLYKFYQVTDGDRPDIVSEKLYGTPDYYWTFFIINEHLKSGITGWPMSSMQLQEYMDQEYQGTVIETYPVVVKDGDGNVTDNRNSVAGRFDLGETITGFLSGATGTLYSIDPQLQQLVLKDVTGVFQANEIVRGSETEDFVTSYRVWDWREAPHHFETSDGLISYNSLHIDEQGSGNIIQPGTSDTELTPVSNVAYETELNDERANIRIVRPEFIYQFAKQFKDLLASTTSVQQ